MITTLLKSLINRKNAVIFALLGAYFLIIYLPYILNGGFIVDDWGSIYHATQYSSFWEDFKNWFPFFSYRPLAPLFIAAFTRLFGALEYPYILMNLGLWTGTILITSKVLKKYTSEAFVVLFLMLALIPVISTTLIFSTVTQLLTGAISFFCWAISLFLLQKYLESDKLTHLIISNLLLVVAFFTYEIILPLLILNLSLPFLRSYLSKKENNLTKKNFGVAGSFLIPPIISLLEQKFIMPRFMQVLTRLDTGFSIEKSSLSLASWLNAIFIDFPILATSSISYNNYEILKRVDFWLGAVIIILILWKLRKRQKENSSKWLKKDKAIFTIFLLSFLASSLIYLLSGRIAMVGSYENRGLSSAWFALSLVGAYLASKFLKTKLFYPIITVYVLAFSSFLISTGSFIDSYRLQKFIGADILRKIESSDQAKREAPITVAANVPHFLEPNYNDEEVLNNFWDVSYMLYFKTNKKIKSANALTQEKVLSDKVKLSSDKIAVDDWEAPLDIWYYEYDQRTKTSSFFKIKDREHLANVLKHVSEKDLGNSPVSHLGGFKASIINRLSRLKHRSN